MLCNLPSLEQDHATLSGGAAFVEVSQAAQAGEDRELDRKERLDRLKVVMLVVRREALDFDPLLRARDAPPEKDAARRPEGRALSQSQGNAPMPECPLVRSL